MDGMSQACTASALAETFVRAVERRDAESLAALYALDCEHVHINRNAPPSRPIVVRGREAIAALWRDDCARDITHHAESRLGVEDRIAVHIACRHPDGTLVASMMFGTLQGGLIRRCVLIECWDE